MTNTTDAPMIFVACADLVVGDAVVENDGYLFAVMAVERKGSMVTARLANDFSPMRDCRSTGAGISMRKRATTRIGVIRGGGGLAVPGMPRPVVSVEQVRDAVLEAVERAGVASVTAVSRAAGVEFAIANAVALDIVADGTIERWQVVQ